MLNYIHSTFFYNHVIAKALIVIVQMSVVFEKSCHGDHEYHDQKMFLTAAYCEYHTKMSTISNTGHGTVFNSHDLTTCL